jgi:hypothetical protein
MAPIVLSANSLEPLCVHLPQSGGVGGKRSKRQSRQSSSSTSPPPPVLATEAPNAFVCPLQNLDARRLEKLRHIMSSLKAKGKHECEFRPQKWRFHIEKPTWKSDIQWLSSADEHTFNNFFRPLWESLGVAKLFAFLGEMELFSGFFVSRQHTRKSTWHTDFSQTGGRAWTLMTPLYDMSALNDCHLLTSVPDGGGGASPSAAAATETPPLDAGGECGDASPSESAALDPDDEVRREAGEERGEEERRCMPTGRVKQYRYKVGECVVFGDEFEHATETGSSPSPLHFLCFTFGDRRMTPEQWASASAYIKEQGPIYGTPSGLLVGVESVT